MITAVVLVNTEFDSQIKVVEKLRKIEGNTGIALTKSSSVL
jgi:hypothetical protein